MYHIMHRFLKSQRVTLNHRSIRNALDKLITHMLAFNIDLNQREKTSFTVKLFKSAPLQAGKRSKILHYT